jgi:coniferyl-aldehyde dehydrogenase
MDSFQSLAVGSSGGEAAMLEAMLRRMREEQLRHGPPGRDERLQSLRALESVLLSGKDEIAAAISRDFGGRSRREVLISEIYLVVAASRRARSRLSSWMRSERRGVAWPFLPARSMVLKQPLGVIGIISPWNYPFHLSFWPLVSALAAGNRAMIKPSELVGETSALMKELVARAFPSDQVAVVTGGHEVGAAFSRLPFDHLVFTGSSRVARSVAASAAANLVPLTLELGGKSPAIVGHDFPIDEAAQRVVAAKLFNAGQTCIAPDYALVPREALDEFARCCAAAAQRLYPSISGNDDYSSIIDGPHYERLQALVEEAGREGARIVVLSGSSEPASGSDRRMPPILVIGPGEDSLLMREEIFGPVLPVLPYGELDEAIAFVNARPKPLALYYFGRDRASVERVLSETHSGGVTVNDAMLHISQDGLPFGGVGESGWGHYHGREGFDAFSKRKAVFFASRLGALGLLRPPYGAVADTIMGILIGKPRQP